MKRRVLVALAVLGVAACGQGATPEAAAVDRDTLTRRQKDSIVSTLPIPGASGVGNALKAVDKANARVQQHDTIR
jgi:ABC-type glycerol-3-phosphate transport system substrate-binding protein